MRIGLRDYIRDNKRQKMKYKYRVTNFLWELRYAWQRAWRGYDSVDIFELGYVFTRKMPILLREFKKNNNGMWYDREFHKQLTKEETNTAIDEMIYYFENCDEDVVYTRVLGEDWPDKWLGCSKEEHLKARDELNRCREEALRLFSKWCWDLWY